MKSEATSGVLAAHLRFLFGAALLGTACIGQVATSPKIQPGGTSGTRLITLGTAGGPLPTRDRAQSSNLLIVNGAHYLIDAGDNVTRRIVQSGSDFRQVGNIFITHPHSDHTMGLATLMVSAWEFQRLEPIDIYGPPGIEALVNGALQYLTVNAEIRWAEGKISPMAGLFRVHEVRPGLVFNEREGGHGNTIVCPAHRYCLRAPGSPPSEQPLPMWWGGFAHRRYTLQYRVLDKTVCGAS